MNTKDLSGRLRTRIVEALTLLADEKLQQRYGSQFDAQQVSHELFNQWDDVFHPEHVQFREAFSNKELKTLMDFNAVINEVSSQTPRELPPIEVFAVSKFGRKLSIAAREALNQLNEDV